MRSRSGQNPSSTAVTFTQNTTRTRIEPTHPRWENTKGRFRFRLSMDEVVFMELGAWILLFGLIGLNLEGRKGIARQAEDLHDRLDMLEEGIQVVGTVLQRLPELVPQFSINQNPLTGIFDFLKDIYVPDAPAEGSIGALPLRDDNGRFTDATKEEENTET